MPFASDFNEQFGGTSAAGSMLARSLGILISASGPLAVPGTCVWDMEWHTAQGGVQEEGTTAGLSEQQIGLKPSPIMELRRLSGLTWEHLAQLFSVSRRSLHFWASGKAQNSQNEVLLSRILSTVKKIYRGSAKATKTALLSAHERGEIPFDLLKEHKFDQVISLLGHGVAVQNTPLRISEESRLAKKPLSPEFLVDAIQDRIPQDDVKIRTDRRKRISKRRRAALETK